jgi:hypothetical protein
VNRGQVKRVGGPSFFRVSSVSLSTTATLVSGGAYTGIVNLDLPGASTGQVLFVEAYATMTKGITTGLIRLEITTSGSTAGLEIGGTLGTIYSDWYSLTSGTSDTFSLYGFYKISSPGTLSLNLLGSSQGSACTLTSGNAQIACAQLNKRI